MSDERKAISCSRSDTYNLDFATKRVHKGGWNSKAIIQRIQERPANHVFGKVRHMSSQNTARKVGWASILLPMLH